MKAESHNQLPKNREGTVPALNTAIEALNLGEKTSTITPAKAVFGSVSVLLTAIRDSMVKELDWVELGLFCAGVCRALGRVTDGKKLDELGQSVHDAISLLMSTMSDIQGKLAKWSKRNAVSRRFHARNDKEMIATWRLDLDKILQVFNKELVKDKNPTVSTVRHNITQTVGEL